MKCSACGSAALIEVTVRDSNTSVIRFYPSDVSTLKTIFGFAVGGRALRAYACMHCQNLQITVEFHETDLERCQQFEGQQPNVLERINSNPEKLES